MSEKKPAHHRAPEGAPKTETPESPSPVPATPSVGVEQAADVAFEDASAPELERFGAKVPQPRTQSGTAPDIAVMPVDSSAPKWTMPRIP